MKNSKGVQTEVDYYRAHKVEYGKTKKVLITLIEGKKREIREVCSF